MSYIYPTLGKWSVAQGLEQNSMEGFGTRLISERTASCIQTLSGNRTSNTHERVHSSDCRRPDQSVDHVYVWLEYPGMPLRANFFFGRGFNLEIFLNLQGLEFIQTFLLIYAKFVVYKSWTRSALLKGTSKCFLVSSITCRSKEAIEWVWSFLCGKIDHKTTPITSSLLSQTMRLGRKNLLVA